MSLIKSGLAVASGTTMSRITGFLRDIFVARYLGATDQADIWVAAFRFPNMFRRIIAEGAFNAAFIPVYSDAMDQNGQKSADLFAGRILSHMLLVIALGILICQIFMPYLVYLIAPGYSADLTIWLKQAVQALLNFQIIPAFPELSQSDKIASTITVTIICLPYAGFMFLAAIQAAILNYHNKFALAAMITVILNLSLMIGLLGSDYFEYSPLMGMAWAAFISGVMQVCFLYVILRRAGLVLQFKKPVSDPLYKKFIRLFIPGMISGGVTQINLLTGSIIASFTPSAMAYLYYADRIYQLPLSLIGVSLGIVLLPNLVKATKGLDFSKASELFIKATEFAAFSTLPAVFALMVIPNVIVSILFENGAFTSVDTSATAYILCIYGLGLPAFIGNKLISPLYYADQDTKTPMKFASLSIVVNIALSFMLFPAIDFYAIPLASVISGWMNTLLLAFYLKNNLRPSFNVKNYITFAKIIAACCVMTIFLMFYQNMILTMFHDFYRIGAVIMILCAMGLYFVICHVIQVFPNFNLKYFFKK